MPKTYTIKGKPAFRAVAWLAGWMLLTLVAFLVTMLVGIFHSVNEQYREHAHMCLLFATAAAGGLCGFMSCLSIVPMSTWVTRDEGPQDPLE